MPDPSMCNRTGPIYMAGSVGNGGFTIFDKSFTAVTANNCWLAAVDNI
tara:strand:- start:97 stop:240 length:144 start_codon:yes stop_codon:yes gene_type:complete